MNTTQEREGETLFIGLLDGLCPPFHIDSKVYCVDAKRTHVLHVCIRLLHKKLIEVWIF